VWPKFDVDLGKLSAKTLDILAQFVHDQLAHVRRKRIGPLAPARPFVKAVLARIEIRQAEVPQRCAPTPMKSGGRIGCSPM
jgi:hypothetical protein